MALWLQLFREMGTLDDDEFRIPSKGHKQRHTCIIRISQRLLYSPLINGEGDRKAVSDIKIAIAIFAVYFYRFWKAR